MAFQRNSRRAILIGLFFCIGFGVLSCKNEAVPMDTNDTPVDSGISAEYIYSTNCSSCHGPEGKRCSGGAKDLSLSKLSKEEIRRIIVEGKGGVMPPFDYVFKDSFSLERTVEYVISLKEE